jgi:hypothetical protein
MWKEAAVVYFKEVHRYFAEVTEKNNDNISQLSHLSKNSTRSFRLRTEFLKPAL